MQCCRLIAHLLPIINTRLYSYKNTRRRVFWKRPPLSAPPPPPPPPPGPHTPTLNLIVVRRLEVVWITQLRFLATTHFQEMPISRRFRSGQSQVEYITYEFRPSDLYKSFLVVRCALLRTERLSYRPAANLPIKVKIFSDNNSYYCFPVCRTTTSITTTTRSSTRI